MQPTALASRRVCSNGHSFKKPHRTPAQKESPAAESIYNMRGTEPRRNHFFSILIANGSIGTHFYNYSGYTIVLLEMGRNVIRLIQAEQNLSFIHARQCNIHHRPQRFHRLPGLLRTPHL